MKKLLIILAFIPLFGIAQEKKILLKTATGIIKFQNKGLTIPDTSSVVTIVGDGVLIGDGLKVGDALITEAIIKMPEQFMKKEETLNELIS